MTSSDKERHKKTPGGVSSYSLRLNGLDYTSILDTLKDHALRLVANSSSEMSEEQWSDYVNELTALYAKTIHEAIQAYTAKQVRVGQEWLIAVGRERLENDDTYTLDAFIEDCESYLEKSELRGGDAA